MNRHVLVVDDDAESSLAIDRQLAELGCHTVVVTSGEEALRVVADDMRIDVLLTALRLRDIDGRELAWAISRKRPFVRVAFIASTAPTEPLELSDTPMLLKPFSATALAAALVQAVPLRRSR